MFFFYSNSMKKNLFNSLEINQRRIKLLFFQFAFKVASKFILANISPSLHISEATQLLKPEAPCFHDSNKVHAQPFFFFLKLISILTSNQMFTYVFLNRGSFFFFFLSSESSLYPTAFCCSSYLHLFSCFSSNQTLLHIVFITCQICIPLQCLLNP